MAENEQVYQFSRSLRFWTYLGAIFFVFVVIWAAKNNVLAGIILLPFALFFIRKSVQFSVNVYLTRHGFGIKKLFRPSHALSWEDIGSVEMKGFFPHLIIKTREEKTLRISSQLEGCVEILDSIRINCPSLFSATGRIIFHRKRGVTLLIMGIGIAMLGFGLMENDQEKLIMFSALALLFGPGALFFEIRKLELRESSLILKYPFREKLIERTEVAEITIEQEKGSYGVRPMIIALYTDRGKRLRLTGYREGDIQLFNALREWR